MARGKSPLIEEIDRIAATIKPWPMYDYSGESEAIWKAARTTEGTATVASTPYSTVPFTVGTSSKPPVIGRATRTDLQKEALRATILLSEELNNPELLPVKLQRNKFIDYGVNCGELLNECLHLVGFRRDQYGYNRASAYRSDMENLSMIKWDETYMAEYKAHLDSMRSAAAKAAAAVIIKHDPADYLPPALFEDIDKAIESVKLGRGTW